MSDADPLGAALARAEVGAMGKTLDALTIILTAPLWPKRDDLSDSGKALHDKIVDTAKPYARAIVEDRFGDALAILAGWSPLLNAFLDDTKVVGHEPSEKLVRVYQHYADQVADLSKIERGEKHVERP